MNLESSIVRIEVKLLKSFSSFEIVVWFVIVSLDDISWNRNFDIITSNKAVLEDK